MDCNSDSTLDALNQRIVECDRCPRLVEWRTAVATEKRKAFAHETYWGRAVPNFGDPQATRLIIGLAPAAHGANRTGRMFTGDRSGDFLYSALHRAGVANQPDSNRLNDGLKLSGVLVTAAVHCAPPANKPTPTEFDACRPYLLELLSGRNWRSVLCLGSHAWEALFKGLKKLGTATTTPKFGHGATWRTSAAEDLEAMKVVASYHPSQQNTFTGRLTEAMLDAAVRSFLADD